MYEVLSKDFNLYFDGLIVTNKRLSCVCMCIRTKSLGLVEICGYVLILFYSILYYIVCCVGFIAVNSSEYTLSKSATK